MIARHSHEQSVAGEGVEVVKNEPCEDPKHGKGQYTEKRIHLSRLVLQICVSCCTAKLFFKMVINLHNFQSSFCISVFKCSNVQ